MKLKTFLITVAIMSCGCGITSLLVPAQVMSLFGVESNPAISLLAQFSGLGSVALGLVPWFTRNMELSKAKETIIPAMLICNVIGIIISVLGTLSGAIKIGWLSSGLYTVFAVGYAWFLFSKSRRI
jgi:asparagine N-glycosylation enzyme membrane subunit Stt3